VVMGVVAGALLGLHGRLGLAGWQWLFLVEGLPAVLLSAVFLIFLPDEPATAKWLSSEEKAWIAGGLAADQAALARTPDPGLWATLASPLVIGMGLVNLLSLGGFYAFNLSAPLLLSQATHMGATGVGFLVAAGGLIGAAVMLANSRRSDRLGERHLHVAIPMIVQGGAFAAMSVFHGPIAMMAAYLLAQAASSAAAAVIWLIPSDRLSGRSAAGGVAAIGSIGMLGSFLAPYGWGLLKDRTGDYAAGLAILPFLFFLGAGIVLWLRATARREDLGAAQVLPVDL